VRIPSQQGRRRARIEIIPLIDIMFFLLATFVMVSLSMVKNQGVSVNLPKAATGQPQQRTMAVTVTVTDAGRVYLNRELMKIDEVPGRLKRMKQQEAELKVLINADETAYFGDVVKILDEVRQIGIEKIAIQTTGAKSGGKNPE
jgi:biopolymer transport protein ExbD